MMKIKGCELRSLNVALRFALFKKWPDNLADWDEKRQADFAAIIREADRRRKARR
jgi:hypothetical protein